MIAYILRRLLLVIPTLLGIMVVNFAIVQVAPGGPVERMIAEIQGEAVEAVGRVSGNVGSEVANAASPTPAPVRRMPPIPRRPGPRSEIYRGTRAPVWFRQAGV